MFWGLSWKTWVGLVVFSIFMTWAAGEDRKEERRQEKKISTYQDCVNHHSVDKEQWLDDHLHIYPSDRPRLWAREEMRVLEMCRRYPTQKQLDEHNKLYPQDEKEKP